MNFRKKMFMIVLLLASALYSCSESLGYDPGLRMKVIDKQAIVNTQWAISKIVLQNGDYIDLTQPYFFENGYRLNFKDNDTLEVFAYCNDVLMSYELETGSKIKIDFVKADSMQCYLTFEFMEAIQTSYKYSLMKDSLNIYTYDPVFNLITLKALNQD